MTIAHERRKYFRLKTENKLKHTKFSFFSGDILSGEAISKDLSVGGLLFESRHLYRLEEVIRIEMNIPGVSIGHTGMIVALGKVVRLEIISAGCYEIGVSFVGIDSEHQTALRQYIQRQIA